MDKPGCFCCQARTCLIIWSTISLCLSFRSLLPLNTDATFHTAFIVLSIISAAFSLLLNGFILLAAIKRNTKYLTICFYLLIVLMLFNFVVVGVGAIINKEPEGISSVEVAVIAVIVIGIVGGLQAWTISRTLTEVEQREATYGSHA